MAGGTITGIAGSAFIVTPLGTLINIVGGPSPKLSGLKVVFGDVEEIFATPAIAALYYDYLVKKLLETTITTPVVASKIAEAGAPSPAAGISPTSADGTVFIDLAITGSDFTNLGGEFVKISEIPFTIAFSSSTSISTTIPEGTLAAGDYPVYYVTFYGKALLLGTLTIT